MGYRVMGSKESDRLKRLTLSLLHNSLRGSHFLAVGVQWDEHKVHSGPGHGVGSASDFV